MCMMVLLRLAWGCFGGLRCNNNTFDRVGLARHFCVYARRPDASVIPMLYSSLRVVHECHTSPSLYKCLHACKHPLYIPK